MVTTNNNSKGVHSHHLNIVVPLGIYYKRMLYVFDDNTPNKNSLSLLKHPNFPNQNLIGTNISQQLKHDPNLNQKE